MKRSLLSVVSVLLLTIVGYSQQNYSPLDLAKLIFGKSKFRDLPRYSTGEYAGHPNGLDFPKSSSTKFLELEQTDDRAVIVMTVLDSKGRGSDTYLHFKKENVWKLEAFRALALTGIIAQVKEELEKMTPAQLDSLANDPKRKEMFPSIDYRFELGNTTLILALDDTIINHFLSHRDDFEKLKEQALNQLNVKGKETEHQLLQELKPEYQKLFISSISFGNPELGNALNFLIGGMGDNTVGYLFVKDKKELPKMSPDTIIMLREIGNGWYLYKTT